jgi:long-subunit acyl-CoA synthetase (AMP-forming)
MPETETKPAIRSTIYDLIADHAQKYPEDIAMSQEAFQLSYRELIVKINQLKSFLYSKGLQRGDIVPVLTSRCPLMVICFTAMMKLGVCYVPIEVETWSEGRVAQVLAAVEPSYVISTEDFQVDHPGLISKEELEIGLQHGEGSLFDEEVETEDVHPEDLAYIIFTSGSSGAPKGVCIARKSLEHYVAQCDPDKPFTLGAMRNDKVLLIFSVAFDGE